MSKKKKILLITLSSVLAAILLTLTIYYFGAFYPKFNKVAIKEFSIPGLETTFVPQGLTYSETTNQFFVTGYMGDKSASRIYVVNKSDYQVEKYFTVKFDNELSTAHFGGIATYNNTVWVTGEDSVLRFNISQIQNVNNGESVEALDEFKTGNACSFLTIKNNQLVVGEFYRDGSHESPSNHHITTNNGTNKSLTVVYDINENNKYGLVDDVAEYGISMPNKVQGMTFNKDGKIVLSTSYAIADSKVYIYENILDGTPSATTTFNNKTLNVYVLEESNLISTLTCPAMSEEVELVDGKVFISFESACKKYKFVNRTRTKHVYSLDI